MNPDLRPPGVTSPREARQTRVTGHGSQVTRHQQKPWYREPWPWLLIAGPAAVLVAGAVTIWLALRSNDGLVADDYYRRGLAINQVLVRDREAARLGLRASVRMTASGAVEVTLSGDPVYPRAVMLTLVHPTRAGEDQSFPLARVGRGVYRSQEGLLPKGRRNAVLEDEAGTWRLAGQWLLPADRPLELTPGGS